MADFKTALDALASGAITHEALGKQLSKLLKENPQFANRLLSQLDEANNQGKLNNKAYADLKRQINDFRREHAAETEAAPSADPDSTEFAPDRSADAPAANVGSEDSTQINENLTVGPVDSTEIKAK